MDTSYPKTAKEARLIRSKFFFTNKICKHGHLCLRYTEDYKCVSCKEQTLKKARKKYDDNNKEKKKLYRLSHKEDAKQYRETNKEKLKELTKNWRKNNQEHTTKYSKNYYKKNKEEILKYSAEYKKKRKKIDIKYKLTCNLRSAIWKYIKYHKISKTSQTILKFSREELIEHLENKFDEKMNWGNYGTYWHIDHIKPITLCSTFEEAWQLSNLQPLEASKNMSKGNRYIG